MTIIDTLSLVMEWCQRHEIRNTVHASDNGKPIYLYIFMFLFWPPFGISKAKFCNKNGNIQILFRVRSGSVVECLTRDQGAAGSSLTASLHCVLEQNTLILA